MSAWSHHHRIPPALWRLRRRRPPNVGAASQVTALVRAALGPARPDLRHCEDHGLDRLGRCGVWWPDGRRVGARRPRVRAGGRAQHLAVGLSGGDVLVGVGWTGEGRVIGAAGSVVSAMPGPGLWRAPAAAYGSTSFGPDNLTVAGLVHVGGEVTTGGSCSRVAGVVTGAEPEPPHDASTVAQPAANATRIAERQRHGFGIGSLHVRTFRAS